MLLSAIDFVVFLSLAVQFAIAGYFLYDSGMAVVGSMVGVVIPAVVWLVVTRNYAMRPDNDARVASGDGDGDRRNAADTTTSTVGALR